MLPRRTDSAAARCATATRTGLPFVNAHAAISIRNIYIYIIIVSIVHLDALWGGEGARRRPPRGMSLRCAPQAGNQAGYCPGHVRLCEAGFAPALHRPQRCGRCGRRNRRVSTLSTMSYGPTEGHRAVARPAGRRVGSQRPGEGRGACPDTGRWYATLWRHSAAREKNKRFRVSVSSRVLIFSKIK